MIASEDLEALDAFEQLFNDLAAGTLGGSSELTVFYLKHAKASLVAETLDQIFGGGTLTEPAESSPGGGRSMLGEMASAALGDAGGGIIGALLGMGGEQGTIAPSGTIRITPDNRLNALIVQANATDLATIEELLKVLDQRESPEEVLVVPKVKVIPVFNTRAEEIATVVKDVYQDRMVTGPQSGGGQRPPTPQELFEMLRSRGGGSSRSRSGSRTEEVQRLALSVDARTNSLVLAAPEPLFTEVQLVIEQLDQAAVETNQAIRVITLHHSSPEAVRRAISAATGETIQFGAGSSRSGYRSSSSGYRPSSSSSSSSGSSSSSSGNRYWGRYGSSGSSSRYYPRPPGQ